MTRVRCGLAERRLDACEVLDLGGRLARILAAVHEAGVVHSDVHPWNVLLAKDGDVELINFDRATTIAEVRPVLDWGAAALAAELERTHPFLRVSSIAHTVIGPASPSAVVSPAMFTTDATEDPALDDACAAAWLPVSAVRYVLRTRATLAVDDATSDDRFARDPYLAGKQRLALFVVPVLCSGDLRAILVLENRLAAGTFTHDRLDVVNMLTGQLAVALDNALLYASLEQRIAERTEELRSANAQLELLSATDALTGVANRRSFDTALTAQWTRSPGQPMSVVMADVDRFKSYNDHHGHPAGDACLIEISRLLVSSLRDTDTLCRYGGEEFAAILPRADLAVAVAVAERMRAAVEDAALPHAPKIGTVTVSIGVASALASRSTPVSDLLAHADAAPGQVRKNGRAHRSADPPR